MDNPSPESSALDTNQAANVFASMLGGGEEPLKEQDAAPAVEQSPEDAALEALKAEQSATESEAQGEQPQKFTVKLDGTDVEVTLDELRNGYQRQADYTRKTMEVSEARKAVETEVNQARQERAQYAQNLQIMQQQLGTALQEQSQINWQQLIETDPVEYLKQKDLFERRQTALYQSQQEQQRVLQLQQAEQAQHIQKFLGEQQEQLLAKLPEWKDESKAKAEKDALKGFLKANSFSDSEIEGVADHRMVLIARDAMRYRALMEKANAASKKVAAAPARVERPGVTESGNVDRRSSSFQRLARSGSVEDAAAVFANFL